MQKTYLETDDVFEEVVRHDRLLQLPEEGLEDDGGNMDVAHVEHDLLAGVDLGLKFRWWEHEDDSFEQSWD